jgi:hypothetical protein
LHGIAQSLSFCDRLVFSTVQEIRELMASHVIEQFPGTEGDIFKGDPCGGKISG